MSPKQVRYSAGLSELFEDPAEEEPGGYCRDDLLFALVKQMATLDDYRLREVLSADLPMSCGSDDDVGDLVIEARTPDIAGPLSPKKAAPMLAGLNTLGASGVLTAKHVPLLSAARGVLLPPWCPPQGVLSFARTHPLAGIPWLNMVRFQQALEPSKDTAHLARLVAWCLENQFPISWRQL